MIENYRMNEHRYVLRDEVCLKIYGRLMAGIFIFIFYFEMTVHLLTHCRQVLPRPLNPSCGCTYGR